MRYNNHKRGNGEGTPKKSLKDYILISIAAVGIGIGGYYWVTTPWMFNDDYKKQQQVINEILMKRKEYDEKLRKGEITWEEYMDGIGELEKIKEEYGIDKRPEHFDFIDENQNKDYTNKGIQEDHGMGRGLNTEEGLEINTKNSKGNPENLETKINKMNRRTNSVNSNTNNINNTNNHTNSIEERIVYDKIESVDDLNMLIKYVSNEELMDKVNDVLRSFDNGLDNNNYDYKDVLVFLRIKRFEPLLKALGESEWVYRLRSGNGNFINKSYLLFQQVFSREEVEKKVDLLTAIINNESSGRTTEEMRLDNERFAYQGVMQVTDEGVRVYNRLVNEYKIRLKLPNGEEIKLEEYSLNDRDDPVKNIIMGSVILDHSLDIAKRKYCFEKYKREFGREPNDEELLAYVSKVRLNNEEKLKVLKDGIAHYFGLVNAPKEIEAYVKRAVDWMEKYNALNNLYDKLDNIKN